MKIGGPINTVTDPVPPPLAYAPRVTNFCAFALRTQTICRLRIIKGSRQVGMMNAVQDTAGVETRKASLVSAAVHKKSSTAVQTLLDRQFT